MYKYYSEYGASVFPQNSQETPFNASSISLTGDPLTNVDENLSAEQKARAVYDNILRLRDDPDVNDVIRFLREREIVHFQRFGEAKRKLTSRKKAHSLRCFAAPIKYKSYDIEL